MLSGGGGNEPGDPRKGAERIISLVQQQVLPMRFALGVSTVRIELLHTSSSSELLKCLPLCTTGRRLGSRSTVARRDRRRVSTLRDFEQRDEPGRVGRVGWRSKAQGKVCKLKCPC